MIAELYLDALQVHDSPPLPDYAVSRFPIASSPPPRRNLPTRARRHGAYGLTTYYEPRAVPLEGKVADADEAAFWGKLDALSALFALRGSAHVVRWRRAGLAYLERASFLVDAELEYEVHNSEPYAEWATTIALPDPRLYSDDLETISFAASGNAQNDGNFSTPPIITFHGPGTDPGLRNDALTTENEMQMDYAMIAGDEIVVDVAETLVTLNGLEAPELVAMPGSFFWQLVAGANSLQKLGGAASIDVDWRHARI